MLAARLREQHDALHTLHTWEALSFLYQERVLYLEVSEGSPDSVIGAKFCNNDHQNGTEGTRQAASQPLSHSLSKRTARKPPAAQRPPCANGCGGAKRVGMDAAETLSNWVPPWSHGLNLTQAQQKSGRALPWACPDQ